MSSPLPIVLASALGFFLSLAPGCASSPGPSAFRVADEEYARAFNATRDELTRMGFELERIDARGGVIETRPKQTAGLATPWDTEQSTLGQNWEDFTNDQRRVVRVTFAPAGAQPDQASPTGREVSVEVTLYRLRVPGQRIETEAIRLSRRSIDEQELASGRAGLYLTPIGRDTRLESRLAAGIQKRSGAVANAD